MFASYAKLPKEQSVRSCIYYKCASWIISTETLLYDDCNRHLQIYLHNLVIQRQILQEYAVDLLQHFKGELIEPRIVKQRLYSVYVCTELYFENG